MCRYAAALEGASGGAGGGEAVESGLPPMPEPLDEKLRVVAGAAHCYR